MFHPLAQLREKKFCLRHAEVTDLVPQTHQASQDDDDEYYRKMDAHLGAVIVVLAFKMCAKTNKTWGLPLGCIRVGDSYYDFVGGLTVLALGNPMLASPKNSLAASCCTVRFDPQASGCAHC